MAKQIILDKWQEDVLKTKGNICLRSGRQVGKSTIISIKAGNYAMENSNKVVMVIASVERQARLLFEKILAHIYDTKKGIIMTGKDRPTRHKLQLKNGSLIHCLPTGESGYGIRGFTIDLLIADEAAFIPEEVWAAVTPMLAVTQGDIWLLSTPHGREGFYCRCFDDEKFTPFHVSSEDCPRRDDEFLAHEKKWMTRAQYAQEYLGEFVDEAQQFFTNEWIKKICIGEGKTITGDCFLGVDIARLGKDESTFEIIRGERNNYKQVHHEITRKVLTTETAKKIINLEMQWKFKNIGVDDAGVGAGVFDQLLANDTTKRKVIGLNNSSREIDREGKKKRLLKEDMYSNLLAMGERKEIELLDNDEVRLSLRSIQYEYGENGKMKIYGSYSHIVEGLIRAAWCAKDKTLNIWVA